MKEGEVMKKKNKKNHFTVFVPKEKQEEFKNYIESIGGHVNGMPNKKDETPQKSFIHKFEDDQPTANWVHDMVSDENYSSGYKILRSCTCSNCGYHSPSEKKVCPKCHSKMV